MSYLIASKAVAHLQRNGDVVLTGQGKLILCCLFFYIFFCAVGVMLVVGDGRSER